MRARNIFAFSLVFLLIFTIGHFSATQFLQIRVAHAEGDGGDGGDGDAGDGGVGDGGDGGVGDAGVQSTGDAGVGSVDDANVMAPASPPVNPAPPVPPVSPAELPPTAPPPVPPPAPAIPPPSLPPVLPPAPPQIPFGPPPSGSPTSGPGNQPFYGLCSDRNALNFDRTLPCVYRPVPASSGISLTRREISPLAFVFLSQVPFTGKDDALETIVYILSILTIAGIMTYHLTRRAH